jgi:outer membrane protein
MTTGDSFFVRITGILTRNWVLLVGSSTLIGFQGPTTAWALDGYQTGTHDNAMVVTLEDAWQLAAQNNKDLQIAREAVILADGQVREAWSAALPRISASGQYQRNIETPVFYISMADPETGEESTQTFKMGEDNSYAGILKLEQPLWLAGKIGLGLKAAKLYRNLSRESLRSAGVYLRYQVAQSFFGVLLAKAMLEVTQENLDLTQQHADRIHRLFEQGQVSEYDVIRADVQVANQRPEVLTAENQLQLAENALKSLLGIDLNRQVEFQGELVPVEQEELTADAAYQLALQRRAEQQILNLQKQINSVQYTAESRDIYWPNFYLSADATWQTQAPDYAFEDYEWNRSVSAYLQVSIPLFDGFETKARKQQVRAQARQLLHQEIQFHDGLRLELQGILDDINTAQERLDAQQQTIGQAQRALDIAEVRYENGISTLLEVLDAQLALRVARTEYLKAVYDQRVAVFALERALGQHGLTPDQIEEQ